jgi:hypothetical protein
LLVAVNKFNPHPILVNVNKLKPYQLFAIFEDKKQGYKGGEIWMNNWNGTKTISQMWKMTPNWKQNVTRNSFSTMN